MKKKINFKRSHQILVRVKCLQDYLDLRSKLIKKAVTFNEWVNEKILEELKK